MMKKTGVCLCACFMALILMLSGCGRKEFSVVFNLNGGELISGKAEQTVKEGEAAIAPIAQKGRAELSWDKDFSEITGNTIINAVWNEKTYKVTFDPVLEGMEKVTVEVRDGEAASIPDFSFDGMELTGWDQDVSKVTKDMTVKAKWEKSVLSGEEISEQARTRVLTVRVHDAAYGGDGTGSGFFIDDQGTLVTNYHVIEYADRISVEMADGATYSVDQIINFSPKFDIAVLKVDITGNDYYPVCSEVSQGSEVYAIGCPLGTLENSVTDGIISNTSRKIGQIPCVQMTAAISPGNSGGPLLNNRGEVIGVNSFSFTNGTDLNLAIDIDILDQMTEPKNFSVNDFMEWWRTEIARSYRPKSADNSRYQYSLLNTYQNYTGVDCILSTDSLDPEEVTDFVEGYNSQYHVYLYSYDKESYDRYVDYIKEMGYEYEPDMSDEANDGILSTYYSASNGVYVMLLVTTERSYLETVVLEICVIYT